MINDKFSEKDKKEAFLNKKPSFDEIVELKIRKSTVEELNVEYFNELFEQSNLDSGKSLEMYNRLGTREGLLKKLGVYYTFIYSRA